MGDFPTPDPKVTRLRKVAPPGEIGLLGHVRSIVDDCYVIRVWPRSGQRWDYRVITPPMLAAGLWAPDGGKNG